MQAAYLQMDAVLDTCSRSRGENIREDQAAKEALGTPFGKTQKCAILTEMGKKIQAQKAILPSTPVCMIGMMIVSGYLFKKMSENPLPSGFLSRHGVKEKHQPLLSKAGTYYGAEGGICLSSLDTRRSARLEGRTAALFTSSRFKSLRAS